jgi:hypothetical protein
VREKLIAFLQSQHPEALPHARQISVDGNEGSPEPQPPKAAARKRTGR